MLSAQLTEQAIRSALLTSDTPEPEKVKENALRRTSELLQGTANSTDLEQNRNLQTAAIGIAVEVLSIGYKAVKDEIHKLNNARELFERERKASVATMLLPLYKEESSLSSEQRAIEAFVRKAKDGSFFRYFGINSEEITDDKNAILYSVLPYYKMSDQLEKPVSSKTPLDIQRTAISLFFKAAAPDEVETLDVKFQKQIKFFEWFKRLFKRDNYLNDIRAPRFITMCLSNLLWNLQHPTDPHTGYPLSLQKCIDLCIDVELFLNDILNADSPPYIYEIANKDSGFISLIKKVELHVRKLRAAFAEEQLHGINYQDVFNSARSVLRIMDNSVLQLIFRAKNELTQKVEPYKDAGVKIAYTISYLNDRLSHSPELMEFFLPFVKTLPRNAMVNCVPMTVVDLLIIFTHLSTSERHQLFSEFEKNNTDSALEMKKTLKDFDKSFLKPIRRVCEKERYQGKKNTAILVGQRIIPFMTLIIEDFLVHVDSLETYDTARASKARQDASATCFTGKEQVDMINHMASQDDSYYNWRISPFVSFKKETENEIDSLPKHQYRMTQITKLLDSIGEIVEKYRSFLQLKEFQEFLIKCLKRVQDEYQQLEEHVLRVNRLLEKDDIMSRGMKGILRPMTGKMGVSLEELALASKTFENVVSDPEFTERQTTQLSIKLEDIDSQFKELFQEDSGMKSLSRKVRQNAWFRDNSNQVMQRTIADIDPSNYVARTIKKPTRVTPIITPVNAPSSTRAIGPDDTINTISSTSTDNSYIEIKKVEALKNLIERCYMALSYQSKHGHKGKLLLDLKNNVAGLENIIETDLIDTIYQLAMVTASFRQNWFFQAQYGQTRSAIELGRAILDKELNNTLPVAEILFGSQVDLDTLTHNDVFNRLRFLRNRCEWRDCEKDVTLNLGLEKMAFHNSEDADVLPIHQTSTL